MLHLAAMLRAITMQRVRVVDALAGEGGSEGEVRGWIRTRRDSKAGLSFLHVHDGTCFNPLQVVAGGELCKAVRRIRWHNAREGRRVVRGV